MNTALRIRTIKAAAFLAGAALSLAAAIAIAGSVEAQTATTSATTTATTTNATSTPAVGPQVSQVLVWNDLDGEGATITWTTNVPATSRVFYGLDSSNYTSSTTRDATLKTSHSALLENLEPGTPYYFMISSENQANATNTVVHYLFTTLDPDDDGDDNGNGTSTATTTDPGLSARVSMLESEIDALQALVAQLQAQIQSLINNGGSNGGNNGGGNGTSTSMVTMSPQNATVRAGTSIDFNGRGFWSEEDVRIMHNGVQIGTAHADGGGNFSTGSMPVSNQTGSRTYTFVGSRSGLTGTATYSVTQ